MFYLLMSIVCSVFIGLIFKYFERFQIQTFLAIVVNYFVCVLVGSLLSGEQPFKLETLALPWLPWAIGLGLLFISGFYAIGLTVQKFGLGLSSVMQKMSLIFSVPFAVLYFNEAWTWLKILGLIFALAAVWLSNRQDKQDKLILTWAFLLPMYVFINAGAIECVLQYAQGRLIQEEEQALFAMIPFGVAGLTGLGFSLRPWLKGQMQWRLKELVAGVVLGIPNYFSIYFLILAMNSMDKSFVIPSANLSVLAISAVLGLYLFKERFNQYKAIGLVLAILAIILLSF